MPTQHLFHVPHPRNPNLVGRESELQELRDRLTAGDLAAQEEREQVTGPSGWTPPGRDDIIALTQSITGLGGIGKTSLAVEYCYKNAAGYDIVWWLRSEDATTLAADYVALAVRLYPELTGQANVPALVEHLRSQLNSLQGVRWLLVFDNANTPQELRDYLPASGHGHILITSRHQNWDHVAYTLPVRTLPRADSVRLLTHNSRDADTAAANALAHELGDFPLALEHARAYVSESGNSLAEYLNLFQTRRRELWQHTPKPFNYRETIATTWDISIQSAAALSPAAADLLNLCAFFGPDDIPLDVIRDGAQFLPASFADAVRDPLVLDPAIATLRRYSLIERKGDNLFIHRLVQTVTRDQLTDAQRKEWTDAAVKAINDAFPFDGDDVRTWSVCARLLSHGLATAEHADSENVAPEQAGRLLNQMGLYVNGRAQFTDAKKLYERALAIWEKALGTDHPNVASGVNNLGMVLRDLGDLPGAKAHFERALAIDEKQFGPEHPEVARDVNNLGSVLRDLGDLPGAKAHFERALAMDEKTLGPDHPNVAIRVNNLGNVLQALGDQEGARAHYERALAIDEKQFGPNHPNVAIRVNNLGGVLQDLGDLQGAKAHFERALAIDEKQFGPDHPEVATDVNNLGLVLRDLGDQEGARAHFERALAIGEKTLGPNHPNVAICVNNLGGVLQDLGDLPGAKAHYERALAIDEKQFGPEHPNVARDVNNLGGVLQDLGDLQSARIHYQRALSIFRQFLGDDHPNTKIVQKNLEALDKTFPKDT